MQLTGAEAALVVNNGAGAVLLAVAATAAPREVIVSRGQLLEMGSYRLSEMIAAGGCVLREVGSTNRTHLDDYARALNDLSGAVVVAHPCNYAVAGCTADVELEELVKLARGKRLSVIHALGSAALVDLGAECDPIAPLVSASIKHGVDVAITSGDKVLGGPQCGIIVGRRASIERLAAHPLARALRVDKLALAALEATLRLYADPATARNSIPILRLLSTPLENLKLRAERLAPQLAAIAGIRAVEPIQGTTHVGGGAVPGQQLPTWSVALQPATSTAEGLASRLRTG
jgi:L-seryl-tRNA(Ser) seleniumtransferase